MGFNKNITTNTEDSQQSSPGYVLTFVRWKYRSVRTNKDEDIDHLEVLEPLVTDSDCVNLTINDSKSSPTGSLSMNLISSSVNYMTAIGPGDFVFVNISNNQQTLQKVKSIAILGEGAINFKDSGFKGIFRIQTINQNMTVNNGIRSVSVSIQANSYMEYQSKIYFNRNATGTNNTHGFSGMHILQLKIEEEKKKGKTLGLTNYIKMIISAFLGAGSESTENNNLMRKELSSPIELPDIISSLLGKEGATTIAEVYRHNIGIEDYTTSDDYLPLGEEDGGFYECTTPIAGAGVFETDLFANNTLWSIIKSYSNPAINEMFTSTKCNIQGNIVPTLTIRQMPFTTELFPNKVLLHENSQIKIDALNNVPKTRFSELPRWSIDGEMLLGYSLSRSDSMRFNFVFLESQLWNKSPQEKDTSAARAWGTGMWDYDENDVKRSGFKPYLISSSNDWSDSGKGGYTKGFNSQGWVALISDWVTGQHLKLTGTINCIGIDEPISIGDNVVFDGMLAHIEGLSHTINVDVTSGAVSFRTSISICNGIKKPIERTRESSDVQQYQEMSYDNNHEYMSDNFKQEGSLPASNYDSESSEEEKANNNFNLDANKRRQNIDNKKNTTETFELQKDKKRGIA